VSLLSVNLIERRQTSYAGLRVNLFDAPGDARSSHGEFPIPGYREPRRGCADRGSSEQHRRAARNCRLRLADALAGTIPVALSPAAKIRIRRGAIDEAQRWRLIP
jgi:hypothetical protein